MCSGSKVLVLQVADNFFRVDLGIVDMSSLENAGEEAVAPKSRAYDRFAGTKNHVTRQILVFCSEAVRDPGTDTRANRLLRTTVHHQQAGLVIGCRRMHGANDAELIGNGAQVRVDLTHRNPALAVLTEFEGRGHVLATFTRFTLLRFKLRLGVKRIHVRRAAIHKQVNDVLGAGSEVRLSRGERIVFRGLEWLFLLKQTREAEHAKSSTTSTQHLSS